MPLRSQLEDREITSMEVISDFIPSSVNGMVDQKLESNGWSSDGNFQFDMVHRTHMFTLICSQNYTQITENKFKE